MSTPTNTTPATAIEITLPYTLTFDPGGLGASWDLYWKYTTIADDVALGAIAYESGGIDVQPEMTFFTGVLAADPWYPTELDVQTDTLCNVPVVALTDYWIKITGSADTNDVVLKVRKNPILGNANGDIIINGDSSETPGKNNPAYVLTTAGVIQELQNVIPGEAGGITDAGTICYDNIDSAEYAIDGIAKIYFYDRTFGLLTSVTFTDTASVDDIYGTADSFYVLVNDGDPTVYKYDESGVLQATYDLSAHIHNIHFLAAAEDGSTLYFADSTTNATIYKYDTTSTVISTFHAAPGSNFKMQVAQSIMTLTSGDVLAAWCDFVANPDVYEVIRYNSAGTPQETTTLTLAVPLSDGPRITADSDRLTSFWVYNSANAVSNRVIKAVQYAIPGSAVLNTFTVPYLYHGYQYNQGSGTTGTTEFFYSTASCAFLILRGTSSGSGGLYVQTTQLPLSAGRSTSTTPARTNDELFQSDSTTLETAIPDPNIVLFPAGD